MKDTERKLHITRELSLLGFKIDSNYPVIGSEFIRWENYSTIEFEKFRILINMKWCLKYKEHVDYWGYDKDAELCNIIVRAFSLISGKPCDKIDLPFRLATRLMVADNILKGIQYQMKINTLFGENFDSIKEITGVQANIIHAMNV